MKNTCIITYEFPPLLGGAGSYASDLAVGLIKNNHNVEVITYNHGNTFLEHIKKMNASYGIRFSYINPFRVLHFFQFFLKIRSRLLKVNFDTIVLSDARAKKTFAFFYPFLKRYIDKSISIIHGQEIEQFFNAPPKSIRWLGINKSMRKLFNAQQKIVTVSKNEYNTWTTIFPDLASKIVMINHGINSDFFYRRTHEEQVTVKEELGIPLNKQIILTASRLTKKKGQDTIIKAYSNIVKAHKNILLVIAGDGDYKKTLEAQVKKYNIEKNVVFTGSLNRETLSKYYAVASIFVLVSRFEEALGLVYLEAAACGAVSIGGHLGGVKDVVLDGKTGCIVNSDDVGDLSNALKTLLDKPELLSTYQKMAWQVFKENFTCEIMAQNLIKII